MVINLKQQEVTEFVLGENTFYVRPFPAMKSANIAADVAKTIGPALGGIFSLINGMSNSESDDGLVANIDPQKAVSVLGEALSSLNGDEMERIIRRLLIDYHNVSISGSCTENKAKLLDIDIFNEVFCCEAQDIFVLCWDVINLNFKSFFGKVRLQFGSLSGNTETMTSNAMASST